MAETFTERKYDTGEVIEKEGDMGVAFYLVKDGSVEIQKCNFFFKDPAPTEIYTLSLHDALPISHATPLRRLGAPSGRTAHLAPRPTRPPGRSEEHTSELQSRGHLVCRLLLE